MAKYSTSGTDFEKRLEKYRKDKQTSYESLKDTLIEFSLNRERISLTDAELQNVFSAIRKNIDIKTWIFPHPIYPQKEGSLNAIFDNLLEMYDSDSEAASKGCRELMYMVIKRAHFDAKNELNTYLNQMIQLFSDQKRFLEEFSKKTNDVLMIMEVEKGLDLEQIEIINKLVGENSEFQNVIGKTEDYVEHINDTIEALQKWKDKIKEDFKKLREKKEFEEKMLATEQQIEEEKLKQREQELLKQKMENISKKRDKVKEAEYGEQEGSEEEKEDGDFGLPQFGGEEGEERER